MKANFTTMKPIHSDNQKGVDIDIEVFGKSTTLNVWCDVAEIDNPTLRVSINSGADHLILVSVEPDDFKEPLVTYSDDHTYCYVSFANNCLHIKLDDEGIVIDVWDQRDQDCSVDTNYVLYDELDEYEDYR